VAYLAASVAVVIDPMAGRLDNAPSELIVDEPVKRRLRLEWILATHVHADHVSGAQHLRERLGGRVAIGGRFVEAQETFVSVCNEDGRFQRNGSQFNYLFAPDEVFAASDILVRAIPTPTHTPACMSYLIGDAVFVGDSIFMPDFC
jgi:glyoxylase-like metal-dependent hydrolase (beta-lactamase superfamily II)